MKPLTSVSFSFYWCCLWLLFASTVCTFCSCNQSSDQVKCIATERVALIEFKNNLTDYANRLSSWSGDDCCSWSGVVCDNSTHHVHEIHLRGPDDTYVEIEEAIKQKLGGTISPSLMKLEQLRYLDLSCNDFGLIPIPTFIGYLHNLRYLNISMLPFIGEIPHQLGNLSSLVVLDINNFFLQSKNLKWIENMKRLRYLDMGRIDLTGASNWFHVINTLPSLQQLHLSSCRLPPIPTEPTTVNFTSLIVLDLSYNHFYRSLFPGWIFSIRDLVSLDLTACSVFGSLNPRNRGGFDSMPSLRMLRLSQNNFSDSLSILKGLPSLSNLRLLDVSFCSFSDPILGSLQNLSQIVHLKLAGNNIVEEIPRSLSNLCNLTTIDLQGNKFFGDVSELLERLCECESPKLEVLTLQRNHLIGRLPQKIGKLKNLVEIGIAYNNLTGILPFSLGSLSVLRRLELGSNQLQGSIPSSISDLSLLEALSLSQNQLGGSIPYSIGDLSMLEYLDLSTNQIEGSIPDSIGNLSSLTGLDLSSNKLNGTLPESIGKLRKLMRIYLHHNLLTGTLTKNHFANLTTLNTFLVGDNKLVFDVVNNWIPPFQLSELSLSSCNLGPLFPSWVQSLKNLRYLNLANANISDTIPNWLMDWEFLETLNLENNKLSGKIPSSLGNNPSLLFLHMRNNKLSGDLPKSLFNSKSLLLLDLAGNELTGRIPMSTGSNLRVLSLRSNKLEGEIATEICHLSSIQILDIADNSFLGYLPTCFTNFTIISGKEKPTFSLMNEVFSNLDPRNMSLVIKGHVSLYSTILDLVTALDFSNNKFFGKIPNELVALSGLRYLNLSHNKLTGRIPNTFGEMRELESLDFSVNNLDGNIPLSLAGLTPLSWLNVSHNNLTGTIPTGRQFQTFNDESCFIGNSLCGAPLPGCRPKSDDTERANGDHDESDGTDWILVICMVVGFAVGFWITIGSLIVSKQWRYPYYHFLDEMWIKLVNFIFLVSIFRRRTIHR